jgi:steroid delta-isomerase-like uncharacterized protein
MTAIVKEKAATSTEQNKKLLRKAVEEVWNNGNFDNMKEMVSDDFVIHFPRPGEDIRGPENVKQFYTEMRNAFPDLHFTIVDLIAEENKVATHWSATGTHKGEFKGIPATGKKVTFNAMDIDKVLNGKFVECWTNVDELGLMQQLGVIPHNKN